MPHINIGICFCSQMVRIDRNLLTRCLSAKREVRYTCDTELKINNNNKIPYISPICPADPKWGTETIFGPWPYLVDIVIPFKFQVDRVTGVAYRVRQKWHLPSENGMAFSTVCTYVLPVILQRKLTSKISRTTRLTAVVFRMVSLVRTASLERANT